jgi:nitrate/nitrite transport system substrate-binding protein
MSDFFFPDPAGSDAPEKPHLRLGFVPLTDCAPLVVAKLKELGRRYGLTLELVRQPSWAAVRDKLLSGELHAAQALYGLVYGVQLGLGGPQADMAVLMTLNQNGQAITLANPLADLVMRGTSVRDSLTSLARRPVFAHTFPTGTHAMWLYYWLATHGVHPLAEVQSVVLPPPQMSSALAEGMLDGFCAGEPWHALAAAQAVGNTVIGSGEIWPDHPEKVLACRRDFAALYPNTARALVMTVLEACRWLEKAEHRLEAAGWLAAAGLVGQPVEVIAPRMIGGATHPLRFFADGAVNFPYLSDGLWFLSQYRRWGLLPDAGDLAATVAAVNQIELYRQAAGQVGIETPASASRKSVLLDGTLWDGSDPLGYAEGFAIRGRDGERVESLR